MGSVICGLGLKTLVNPLLNLHALALVLLASGSYRNGALFGSGGGLINPGGFPGSNGERVAFPLFASSPSRSNAVVPKAFSISFAVQFIHVPFTTIFLILKNRNGGECW